MKIYTNLIDLATPSEKKFWVAPYSQFGIGIKFVANGEEVEGAVILKDRDGNEMTADEQKYGDGFTVFKTSSSEGEKTDVYTAVAPNGQQVQIIQNTSDSTVFEIDEAGGAGVPENLKTKSIVTNALSVQTTYGDNDFVFNTNFRSETPEILASANEDATRIRLQPAYPFLTLEADWGDDHYTYAQYMVDSINFKSKTPIEDEDGNITGYTEENYTFRPRTVDINGTRFKILAAELDTEPQE